MICLFGGTFDPIHNGHLHAARASSAALAGAPVSMVLSARPSHRSSQGASIQQRWEMLCLACEGDSRLLPDDREVRREKPSYTVDTLAELRAEHPHEPIVWIIGSDAFELLTSWHQWQQIPRLTNLLVLKRPGHPLTLQPELRALLEAPRVESFDHVPAGGMKILDHDMLRVSAEEIREILARGGDAGHLLPGAVATYITDHGLYGVISDPRSAE